jgi:arylsulfate sulfotransferase
LLLTVPNRRIAGYSCVLPLILLLTGCGQSQPISVVLSPQSVAITNGQSQQFTASVRPDPSGVNWSVNGVINGNATVGTIDSAGNYTAPQGPQSIISTITATSKSDPTKSASATVKVIAPGVITVTANAQVAQYTISPPAAANVSAQFGLATNYGLTTWAQPTPQAGGPVSLFVAGMRANSVYHIQGIVQFSDGTQFKDADQTFTTGELPAARLPSITTTTAPGMTPQSGVELLDLLTTGASTKFGVAVTDLSGNVLWTYDPGLPAGLIANPVKLLPNGHFLINYSGANPDGANSVLQEVDLAGQVIWQMTAAQLNTALGAATCAGCNITVAGTHHDFALLPSGHLIVIAAQQKVVSGVTVTGDVLIDLDQNHKPVWLWNEFDHLDINRRPYMYPDWTHTNAVIYSADDGNLIVSIRHQNWLVKVDYANGAGAGDILWHLGSQGDFTLQGGTGPTDWFYAQHGPSFTTANTTGDFSLVLFDNGDDRTFAAGVKCGTSGQPPCLYSTVPLLQIDETAKTATLEFHPVAPFYSFFGGNAEVLKNGNVEYNECATSSPANNAAISEVTQASTPETVWQMQITGQYAYRGMRMPSLYPGVQW